MDYDTIFLTPDCGCWDPNQLNWAEGEESLLDSNGEIPFQILKEPPHLINELDAQVCSVEARALLYLHSSFLYCT